MLITSSQKLFPADHSDAQEMSQEALLVRDMRHEAISVLNGNCLQGIKLFYLALERLLEKEVQQRGDKNLSLLFRSQGFLLSVMACCFEIVVEAFGTVGPEFERTRGISVRSEATVAVNLAAFVASEAF